MDCCVEVCNKVNVGLTFSCFILMIPRQKIKNLIIFNISSIFR